MLHDVVIVGAGPVGSTLALSLTAGDVDVTLLDARPAGHTPAATARSRCRTARA